MATKTKYVPVTEFLETYKRLEEMVRQVYGADATVLSYESKLSTEEQDHMSLCRRMRNYAQHHSDADAYVGVTEPMLKFLKAHVQAVAAARDTVGKLAKKIRALPLSADTSAACAWSLRQGTDFAPVVDKGGRIVGYVDDVTIKQVVCKLSSGHARPVLSLQKTGIDLPKTLRTPFGMELPADTVFSDLFASPEYAGFLERNGTVVVVQGADRKYVGILSKKVGNWK